MTLMAHHKGTTVIAALPLIPVSCYTKTPQKFLTKTPSSAIYTSTHDLRKLSLFKFISLIPVESETFLEDQMQKLVVIC